MRHPNEVDFNGATNPSCPWNSHPLDDESMDLDGKPRSRIGTESNRSKECGVFLDTYGCIL